MSKRNKWEKPKKELCNILTRIGAIQFGIFNLADDKLSPYYIDLRVIPSFPEAFAEVEKLFHQVAVEELDLKDVKRIAGIPTAGMPFASTLAFSLSKPFLYVRRETSRGRQRRVEGILNPGDAVLLIDDLITTGKTMLAAADAIRSEGGVVKDAIVLIDRQEGGGAALEAQGIRLHYFIRMTEAARILYDTGAIDKEQLSDILKQIT
ncbi:MAG: phosphoribosyltransferase family protein [Candidatus Bathyarchaeota archaeon]